MQKKSLLLFSIISSFATSAFADNSAYIVYDFKNQQILESKNPNLSRPIASITKLMTANVFLENNQDPNCTAKITKEDADKIKFTGTKLPRGVEISCNELLKAMLVQSDNYAAHALSRATNMTRSQFIKKMNQKAKELGMYNTVFADSSGLSKENRSSVLDLTKLAKYSLNKKVLRELSNTKELSVKAGKQRILMRNTNMLVRSGQFDAALSKTGFTREAGYSLVFVNDNMCSNGRAVGVISLNNDSSVERANFTNKKLQQFGCI